MSSEHERRRFPRYPLRLRARLRHGHEEVDAEVLNASVGGCLLVAHLRVGSRNLVGWAVFFVTAVAALAVNLAHHW